MKRTPSRPFLASALPALAATGVLALSGCALHLKDRGPTQHVDPAPTGAPAAPETALAERYHRAGGAPEVYGIQSRPGSDRAPVITVWTRNRDDSFEAFETLKDGVTGFLNREEHVSLAKGYELFVLLPTGALLHRWDMRP